MRIADGSDPNGDSGNVELNRTIADSDSSCYVEVRLLPRGAHHIRQFGRTVHSDRQVDGTVVASEAYSEEVEDMIPTVACCYGVPDLTEGQRMGQAGEGSTVGRYEEAVE